MGDQPAAVNIDLAGSAERVSVGMNEQTGGARFGDATLATLDDLKLMRFARHPRRAVVAPLADEVGEIERFHKMLLRECF